METVLQNVHLFRIIAPQFYYMQPDLITWT